MPRRKQKLVKSAENTIESTKHRKARTVEGRENQMIALATNKVEERIRNGTASSQEYVHFLRLGASREKQRLENEKLKLELELVKAKTEAMKSIQRNEDLFKDAIKYMTVYQGRGEPEDYDQDLY